MIDTQKIISRYKSLWQFVIYQYSNLRHIVMGKLLLNSSCGERLEFKSCHTAINFYQKYIGYLCICPYMGCSTLGMTGLEYNVLTELSIFKTSAQENDSFSRESYSVSAASTCMSKSISKSLARTWLMQSYTSLSTG